MEKYKELMMQYKYDLPSICVNSTNYNNDTYVGIKFIDNQIKVYFPLGYNIPKTNRECRLSILYLLKTIDLAKKIERQKNEIGDNNGDNHDLPITAFLWILNDFLNNGLYHDIEKRYKQNSNGKINWKRTLNTNSYISNGNAIFLNPYVEKNSVEKNIITDIHSYCVVKSIEYIGWLFGNIELPSYNINENNLKYYLTIINKEFMKSFDDRKKMLLLNVKKVLEQVINNKTSRELENYGVNKYQYVWEYIVNDVFGNDEIEKYFPSSTWHILNYKQYEDSKLRPDTVLKISNKLYILDSKYYKFGVTGNMRHLPHTDSVQKQITYGEYADNNSFAFDEIYNAFIVPYSKINNKFNCDKYIEYVGFAQSNWKNYIEHNKMYEHISLILIDTKYLIDCYYGNEKANLELLVSSIKRVVDTF